MSEINKLPLYNFYYRPAGMDNFMGSDIKGYVCGIACMPGYYTKEEMEKIIDKHLKMENENFNIADLTYVGTYPFNDKYGTISSDVWVANIETIYV